MFVARHVRTALAMVAGAAALSVTQAQAQQPNGPLVLCQPGDYAVSVTPDGGAGGSVSWPENTNGHTSTFTVRNTSATCANSYSLSDSVTGPISGASLNKTNTGTLQPGTSTTVVATYNVGAAGSGTLTLSANGQYGGVWDTGYFNVTVQPPPGAPTVESWAYEDPAKRQDYGMCAVACYAFTYAQSTVPYFSLDTPRNVTLVYNSDRANPRPFVHVDVKRNAGYAEAPQKFQLQVKIDTTFVRFLNGETTLNFQHVDDQTFHRIGGQFDASGYGTGVYAMTIIVSAVYSGSVVSTTIPTVFVQENEATSPIGRGWMVAGVPRLYALGDGSALITEGDGNAVYFKWTGSAYQSPVGEFSRLTRVGAEWRRDFPDSSRAYFNSAGRALWVADRFSNTTSFDYDGANRLWHITDPTGSLVTTLTYTGAYLSGMQDPFYRFTNVTVQADGRLTAIQDPDNVSTSFGYDSRGRLATITDRHGFTSTIGYQTADSSWKLASLTAPAVPIYNLGTVSPVTTYSPWQTKGVPYVLTSGTAYPNGQRDTVSGTLTDPEAHTTRYAWLGRYWQAMHIDLPDSFVVLPRYTNQNLLRGNNLPIGGLDSVGYNTSGLPVYTKPAGRSATNVHYAGWALPDSVWGEGQPTTRPFVSAPGKLDSVKVGGSTMKYTYDSRGRVLTARDPAGHTTSYDYSGTNGNTRVVTAANGETTTYWYDTYGRDTAVTAAGLPTRRVHYDLLNRSVDVFDGVYATPTHYDYDLGSYEPNEY